MIVRLVVASSLGAALVACGGPEPDRGPGGEVPPARPVPAASPVPGPPPGAVDAPAVLRLPTIGITAVVVPVGVDGRGQMEVPEDVRTVGWYRFGPAPGAGAGSAVLAGHVDDRLQGRGSFFELGDLEPGDPVQVDRAGGGRLDYRVLGVERLPKPELPVDRLFARDGREVLVLVTCGGDFDGAAGAYRENVVVTAGPAR